MNNTANTLQINTLRQNYPNAPQHILKAIEKASSASGVDFSYLVQQANVESSFQNDIKSRSSSATGLYQFIDSTWMQMVDRYGADYGLNTNGMSKREILNLRKNPEASSFMAAAFASENEKTLNANWGGDVGATELYFAHFLGAGGASSFLKARDENPMQTAADLFPQAARSNRNVFYDQTTGRARSLDEVYAFFDAKFTDTPMKNHKSISSESLLAQAPTKNNIFAQNLAATNSPSGSSDENTQTLNERYSPTRKISRGLSNSVVMQRAALMREASSNTDYSATQNNTVIKNTAYRASGNLNAENRASPYAALVASPLDLMMMTQTARPGKVIRDIG